MNTNCLITWLRDRAASTVEANGSRATPVSDAFFEAADQLERHLWRPINTAPKGNGDAIRDRHDLDYVEAPKILLRFGDEAVAIGYWDWYYAEGGRGFRDGFAWVCQEFGEPLNLKYSTAPTHWASLPEPPTEEK